MTTDKAAYDAGETAALMLESPFQKREALAVVEEPDGQPLRVGRGRGAASASFELPIASDYMPRLPVHFLLMRGRLPGAGRQPGNSADLGRPATLGGHHLARGGAGREPRRREARRIRRRRCPARRSR